MLRAEQSSLVFWRLTQHNAQAMVTVLLQIYDVMQGHLASSLAGCLRSVGYDMPRVCDVIPVLDNVVGFFTTQLQDMGNGALYCPRVAPTRGAVTCNYEQ